MGADKLAENTPIDLEFICPNCLPKPKVLDFNEKRLHWASVVRVYSQKLAKTNNHREVFINKNTFAFNKNKKRTRLWSISGKKGTNILQEFEKEYRLTYPAKTMKQSNRFQVSDK